MDNNAVESIGIFYYLGSMVTTIGDTDEDIAARINKAKAAFGVLRSIWRSRQISTRTKLRLINSNVKSVLFYGCETWKRTSFIDARLHTFINTCRRQILNVWWPKRIRNIDIITLANQIAGPVEVCERNWRWIGGSTGNIT